MTDMKTGLPNGLVILLLAALSWLIVGGVFWLVTALGAYW
jgi:hypothetical protein